MTAISQRRKADVQQTPDLDELATSLLGFGHPIRIRIVIALRAKGAVKSPSELANMLTPTPLGVTSYHVRMLKQYGMLELVRTEPRRGAVEHYYKLTDEAHRLRKLLRL